MSTRYSDQGYPLLHWAREIEAICPKCGGLGVINGNPSWKEWNATFLCQKCSHSMRTERDGWHGPVLATGRRPCGTCGHKWVYFEKLFDTPKSVKSLVASSSCPECKSSNEVELSFTRSEPVDHAIDPFFGLDLALKENTRYGTVWAYGGEHLFELKSYISAQLRENSGTKWSYFTRLPKWLKTAKNRALILKAIAKLEKRLITSRTT